MLLFRHLASRMYFYFEDIKELNQIYNIQFYLVKNKVVSEINSNINHLLKIIVRSMSWISRGIIFIILFEVFSFSASKLELLLFNDSPGAYSRIYTGTEWRTENHAWGAWHKVNSKADRHQKSCFDVVYESNDVGARDSIDYLSLSSDNNVAIIGDSMVEGYGVDHADTFSYKLKGVYGKQGLNFGASGNFGPVQQYLLYKSLIAKIPHNEVIYFFLPANDFSDNDGHEMEYFGDRYRPYFFGKDYEIVYPDRATPTEWFPSSETEKLNKDSFIQIIKTTLVEYTWSANSLRTMSHLIKNFKSKSNFKTKSNSDYGYFTTDFYSVNGAMTYVEKLFSEIPENYLKTIIVIPTKFDLENIQNGQKYMHLIWYDKIKTIATNYDAKFIDLATVKDYDASMFFSCDGHWNKKGNKKVLETFI